MNEREEFLQYFRSVFIKMVERMDTMTETQVLDGLLEVKAARSVYKEEFIEQIEAMIQNQVPEQQRTVGTWRGIGTESVDLRSIQAFLNSVDKLRLYLGARARSGGSPPFLFDSLEDALKKRLEMLREMPSDS